MNLIEEYIEINPKVMMGKPVIKGTRITVELILEKLSVGESFQEILDEHPRLRQEHILAALAFATATLKNEVLIPIAKVA
ncbi:MAG: DUF433 domain-containing protein [Saprospiraceae bacterium]|nr:DUF433 domain-containing protein [Saprospiraceae bacterium]